MTVYLLLSSNPELCSDGYRETMPGSKSAQDSIAQTLDSLTSDSSKGVPGIVFRAVGKDGGVIASHASGCRGLNHKELPMTEDTVFYIASCTKMVTGIACMQLVEQESCISTRLPGTCCPG